jgi:Ca2+-binding RTX toxin-like protein
MVYDILAAQHMYGANWEHNSGNNIYTFDPTEEVRKTIWDGGGQDTFDFSSFALDLAVDLTPGSYSDAPIPGWDAAQNIGIAFEAFIESVIGGSGNDDLSGNSVDNTLAGGAGNDTLAGGGGSDTFSFSGLFGADTISDFSVGEDAVALLGSDGRDLKGISNLLNIETTPDGDARITADISDEGISGSITLLGITADAAEGIFATLGETIIGTSAGDILNGTSGADLIEAKAGDDTVEGSQGDDKIDGGTGRDTVIYSGNQTSYTLTLGPTSASLTDRRTDGSGTDTLIDMEFLDFDTDLLGGPFDLTTFGGTAELSAPEFESFIELYIAYFNRAPDAIGLNFWGTAFATGTTLEDMASLFIDQDETRAAYPAGTSNEDFATTVYDNVLGRTPDAVGFNFWVAHLDSGNVSRDQFILEVLRGVKPGTSDKTYLDNKIDLGAHFAVHKGMSDADHAATAIDLFDTAGMDTALAAIDGYYAEAQDPDTGEFLMPVIGVLDDPFHTA